MASAEVTDSATDEAASTMKPESPIRGQSADVSYNIIHAQQENVF